jgi:hypothetical protein
MLKRLQYFIFISILAALFSVWMYHFKSSISLPVERSFYPVKGHNKILYCHIRKLTNVCALCIFALCNNESNIKCEN